MDNKWLNPDRCYERVSFEELSIEQDDSKDWIKRLSRLLTHVEKASALTPDKPDFFYHALQVHVGEQSTFQQKNRLIYALALIASILEDKIPKRILNADQKKAICEVIQEEIKECTPGFLIRIQSVLLSLNKAQTLDELLAYIRLQIVDKAYAPYLYHEQSVHIRQQFYLIATALGYSLPIEKFDDPHACVLLDHAVQQAITRQFKMDYTPTEIFSSLWQTAFADFGYRGLLENESYPYSVYWNIFEFVKKNLAIDTLVLQDLFIIDYDEDDHERVLGVDWIKLDSLLIKVLTERKYLRAPAYSTIYSKDGEALILETFDFNSGGIKLIYNGNTSFIGVKHENKYGLLAAVPLELIKLLIQSRDKNSGTFVLKSCIEALHQSQNKMEFRTTLDFLGSLCENFDDFKEMRSCIPPDLRFTFCKISISQLPNPYIKNSIDLEYLLKILTPGERSAIFDVIKNALPEFVYTSDDFERLIKQLSSKHQRNDFFVTMKPLLPKLIKHVGDMKQIFKSVPLKIKVLFYHEIHSHDLITPFIKNINNLKDFLIYLPPELCSEFLNDPSHLQFNALIDNSNSLCQLLFPLSYEQRNAVYYWLKNTGWLNRHIQTSQDIGMLIRYFSAAQSMVICNDLIEILTKTITSAADFRTVLSLIRPEQRSSLYHEMKTLLPGLIHDAHQFNQCFQLLSHNKQHEVLLLIPEKLSVIIHHQDDLWKVLEHLSVQDYFYIFSKISIKNVMKNTHVFSMFLQKLSSSQCQAVCELIGKELPGLLTQVSAIDTIAIPSENLTILFSTLKKMKLLDQTFHQIADFRRMLKMLVEEKQRTFLCMKILPLPNQLIKNTEDFLSLIQYIEEPLRSEVFHVMKNDLPRMITNSLDIKRIFKMLRAHDRITFFKIIEPDLYRYIDTLDNLKDLLCFLPPDFCGQVYSTFGKWVVLSCKQFNEVMSELADAQRTAIFEIMDPRTLPPIKNGADLGHLIATLSPEQCHWVCLSMIDEIPSIIRNAHEFRAFFHLLSHDQRRLVFNAMIDILPSMILKTDDFSGFSMNYLSDIQQLKLCVEIAHLQYKIYRQEHPLGSRHLKINFFQPNTSTRIDRFKAVIEDAKSIKEVKPILDQLRAPSHQSSFTTFFLLTLMQSKNLKRKFNLDGNMEVDFKRKRERLTLFDAMKSDDGEFTPSQLPLQKAFSS